MKGIIISDTRRRKAIAALILITPLCTLLPYLAPSVLMSDMMADLNIGLSQAGLTITIVLVSCGLCMFMGSLIHDKIGIRKTLILAVWLLMAGSVICYSAKSFAVFMIGRIVSGIGFGLNSVSLNPYMSTWFEGKWRTFMITANLISNCIIGAVSYMIVNPIKELVSSWQGVFGFYAVLIAVIALLWMVLSRDSITAKHVDGNNIARNKSLSQALRIKQFWVLMICGIFMNAAVTATVTYLPTFLAGEKGYSVAEASAASSINAFVNMVGALLGGVLAAKTGKRKIIVQLGFIFSMLGGVMFTLVSAQTLVYTGIVLFGLSYMCTMPAQSTIIMETPRSFDPAIIGAATAMVTGIGQILSVVVSPLFSKLSVSLGMSGAMLTFFALVLISVIMSFFIRETGKKTEKQLS